MNRVLKTYIRYVDGFNRKIGRMVMYGVFVIMAILLWSSISKTFFNPSLWTLELAQFSLVAYYILGGPYSMQLDAHVRMDLLYGEWPRRKKSIVDSITVFFLLFYLLILLWGGIDSTIYSLSYGGERSNSVWRPYLWPIKSIMVFGIFLMILQTISEFFKDILRLRRDPYETQEPAQ